jgi:hypothetical protein
MTLTCKWVNDQTGALIMKWTEDEVSVMKPEHEVSQRYPSTRNHEHRAADLVSSAMPRYPQAA